MQDNEIKLGEGIGQIKFGLTMEDVEAALGEPEEIEESDEEDEFEHKVWNYWEEGYSFYFDHEDDYRLSCIETADPEVKLFGQKIFGMTQKEIEEMMKSKGIVNPERETLETGETRVSYEKEMIDMYFDKNALVSINFGVFINDDLEVKWPS
ncbi:hypothetical protein [Adhaeribacter soli]|uniref:Uncharacterized protein n=1 Tax=Adhaeribacter soli TaxID=2607655 RepID=A0A5N1J0T7_9BACT|nr:hypothetical protein [Adhaeribacter soli]KAA9340008.1 hypothetical protein F0P94_06565 [Adhaeribacter soli]